MKNLKDKISNIAGIVGAIAGTIILVASTGGVAIPVAVVLGSKTAGVVAASIIAYLTGKNPNGSTKTEEQLTSQSLNPKK